MRSSIGWTLIGWYGLLLTAVLAVFGGTLYWQAAATTLGGVDAALEARAEAIVAGLEWDDEEGWEIELSSDYLSGLAAECYYRVWSPEGELLATQGDGGTLPSDDTAALQARGDLREITLAGRLGSRVVVGRSVAPERAALRRLLGVVVGAGLAVLALALWSGARLARRSLAPVAAMTATAASIDASDLSARLDVEHSPLELQGLTRTFNETLDRLEAAFVRQARFTADASHELRTPVAVIRTQVELALKRARTPEEYRAALEACLRGAERMTDVLEGLLALARGDAGDVRLVAERVSLDQLLRETVELQRPAAEAQDVALDVRTHPVEVDGDARLLTDLFENLVSNGVRYNRPGGRVEVALSRENGTALVSVTDTGIGIPEESLPHLFERFFRVDPARSRACGGTGLGLSIAHWIAAAHGGGIDVESREGVGSTLRVRLPATGTPSPDISRG